MTAVMLIYSLVAAAGTVLMIRTLIGPSVADRLVGLDALLIVVIALVVAYAAKGAGGTLFVDVALVISLLAFVSTCIASHFIEQRGR